MKVMEALEMKVTPQIPISVNGITRHNLSTANIRGMQRKENQSDIRFDTDQRSATAMLLQKQKGILC